MLRAADMIADVGYWVMLLGFPLIFVLMGLEVVRNVRRKLRLSRSHHSKIKTDV